jgi:hypothetical protein
VNGHITTLPKLPTHPQAASKNRHIAWRSSNTQIQMLRATSRPRIVARCSIGMLHYYITFIQRTGMCIAWILTHIILIPLSANHPHAPPLALWRPGNGCTRSQVPKTALQTLLQQAMSPPPAVSSERPSAPVRRLRSQAGMGLTCAAAAKRPPGAAVGGSPEPRSPAGVHAGSATSNAWPA